MSSAPTILIGTSSSSFRRWLGARGNPPSATSSLLRLSRGGSPVSYHIFVVGPYSRAWRRRGPGVGYHPPVADPAFPSLALLVVSRDEPGALYRVAEVIYRHGANISYIATSTVAETQIELEGVGDGDGLVAELE